MKLHDPDTEKELIRIARNVVGSAGFLKSDFSFWARLWRKALISVALIYALSIMFTLVADGAVNGVLRNGICAILMMYLVRIGLDRIAVAFQSAGFFGTLANLPIRGRTALIHIRSVIFRRFWFTPLIASFIAAICLHYPFDPEETPDVVATWALLTAIAWTTPCIMQVGWVHRMRLLKIWHWAAYCVIAYVVIFYFFNGRSLFPRDVLTAMDHWIMGIIWIFPPAWVFPEMSARGGLIPAAIWIAWGAWSWIRWPTAMFRGYDLPHDFIGAFGGVGIAEKIAVAEILPDSGEDLITLEPPPQPPSGGWVERLIAAALPASDRAVAAAFLLGTNHTRRVNLSMIFAVSWLLVLGFTKKLFYQEPYRDVIFQQAWLIPSIFFVLGLLPLGNPLRSAVAPCPAGNTPVPFFTMLPVTLRSLLRITLRIVIVRTVIAVAIATPFFWILAKIHGLEDVEVIIIAMIPAIGIAWILSVPAILANQLDSHLRRRKGIFPLILATSLVQVPIYILWIMAGIASVGASATWGMDAGSGPYAFLMLPAAIGCFALSAVMSWVIFEILHLSLRQRRYDWKSKIR